MVLVSRKIEISFSWILLLKCRKTLGGYLKFSRLHRDGNLSTEKHIWCWWSSGLWVRLFSENLSLTGRINNGPIQVWSRQYNLQTDSTMHRSLKVIIILRYHCYVHRVVSLDPYVTGKLPHYNRIVKEVKGWQKNLFFNIFISIKPKSQNKRTWSNTRVRKGVDKQHHPLCDRKRFHGKWSWTIIKK